MHTLIYHLSRNSDEAFDVGQFKGLTGNNILAYSRTLKPEFYLYVTLVNFNAEEASYDFSGQFGNYETGIVYFCTKGTNGTYPPRYV